MEEVSKESGHRPSVSMPSLDPTDDFPSHTESSEPVFVLTDSYISTASTDTIVPSEASSASTSEGLPLPISSSESISAENTQSVEESSTGTLTEEVSTESLIESGPVNSFVEGNSSEPSTEVLIESAQTATLTDGQSEVSQPGLDESQVEEDDSIAIDQFIKKIADEQLSSKRIEERKEEEAQEHGENDGNVNEDENKEAIASSNNEEPNNESTTNVLSEEASESHDTPVESASSVMEQNPIEMNDSSLLSGALPLDNIIPPKQEAEIEPEMKQEAELEPMEVVSETPAVPSLEEKTAKDPPKIIEEDELMQAESIEEIQKEINRIPPKKIASSDESSKMNDSNTQNGKEDSAALTNSNNCNDHNMEDESIEQILSSGLDPPKVGHILKSVLENQHKTPTIEDSAEVAKDPILIEKAQEEIKKLDVLVCGECHNAFYYIQELVEHKKGKCPQVSCLSGTCEAESKPQVWGFILWKVKQIKDLKDNVPSSWSVYQTWCKLPQADKNAWITAGQSIQFASKIGNAKVTEVRPAKPSRQTTVQKISKTASPPPLEFVDSNKENSSNMDFEDSPSNIIKKGFAKPVRLNNDVTILPSPKNPMNNVMTSTPNTAVRTTKVVSMQKDEFVVEKIMAKRFNPRKKTWEYNIKWENFGHDSNTWEPISNLSHCKKLLEQFEEQLRRMKEEKAKQAAQSHKGRGRPSNPRPIKPTATNFVPIAPKSIATISNVVGGVSDDYAGGSGHRPQRSSKQKAMSQVKQWCGNISDDDGSGAVGLKRKHESDDSDEDFDDKKIKLEEDSDYSDKDVKPKITFKKVPSTFKPNPVRTTITTPVKNGNSTSSQVLPSNILIPDANGVVRINQKQLPALSSGVYIMSKTAGIIKLDSTTSKVATSGGQTIVKVAPKIGQTQIKIVKKDGNTTKQIIQVSPKTTASTTPLKITSNLNKATPKITPKIRKEVKKPPPLTEPVAKLTPKKSDATPSKKPAPESDSDDGLEPLPFPDPDEPIPDLEEDKDEEFVLDPATGKLAGVEYVDKPVVIKEEPQPRPPSTNELENIVKMAAADLSDEDLHNSDSQDEPELFIPRKSVSQTIKTDQKPVESGTPGVRKVVKYTVGGQSVRAENPSILNKTLMQGQQKPVPTIVKSAASQQQQRRVVQQKVINQMVSQRAPGQTRTVVRHVIEPSRPGQGGNINVIRKTVTSTQRPKFNLSPQKPLPSPLHPTRTYSAMGGIRQANTGAGPGSKVQVYSAKSNVSASQTTAGQMQQGAIRRIGNTVVRSTSVPATKQQQYTHTPQKQQVTRIVQRVAASPKKPAAQQVSKPVTTPVKPRTVINMPSLTEDDTPLSPPKQQQKAPPPTSVASTQPAQQKVAAAAAAAASKTTTTTNVIKQEPILKDEEAIAEEPSSLQAEALEAGTVADQTDWSSFTMADGDNPIYVTGDDGTIYQVAGQNEQGQTILITQGADGQQQCLLVTNEISEMAPDEPQPSTSSAAMSVDTETTEIESTVAPPPVTTEAQEVAVPTSVAASVEESLQTPLQIKTDSPEIDGIDDGVQDQVVAQVVRAEPPSPGGTHKVVVMLPDGNLMVTQVSPEEYASLELE